VVALPSSLLAPWRDNHRILKFSEAAFVLMHSPFQVIYLLALLGQLCLSSIDPLFLWSVSGSLLRYFARVAVWVLKDEKLLK
jgi:hypothetical protein